MAAIKVKRCLFIGLGGTGMTSLLNTKKIITETYGEVPPMIGFLGIDTDGGVYNRSLPSKHGEIKLSPNEQLPIQVQNASPIYERSKDKFNWIPTENVSALVSMMLGAGQIRTNGRFALTVNAKDVKEKLQSVITRIAMASLIGNAKYEPISPEVEIHMVFSLGGGTGCGTFISMAYLIKDLLPTCKLVGYGVLPDVFKIMAAAGTTYVKANAYGAIKDLDYFMDMDMSKEPVVLQQIMMPDIEVKERPFNAFYVVDNKNKDLDTYTHVDQIAEMIGLSLITCTGALSEASASMSDNVEKIIRDGAFNIENKKAWVSGLGICEIKFKGNELSEIYSYKTVCRIINRMLNSCVDANKIANDWIDSISIRENLGKNDVIDYLCSKVSQYNFDVINDKSVPATECNDYLERVSMPKPQEIEQKISELKEKTYNSLIELLKKEINKECGVKTCEDVILAIVNQVGLCMEEMKEELEDFQTKQPMLESALKTAMQELSDRNGTLFKRGLSDYVTTTCEAATNLSINKREIIRRNGAILFYNWLNTVLLDAQQKVNEIKNILVKIELDCKSKSDNIQYNVGSTSKTFQIELAQSYANRITFNDNEIVITDFLASISLPNKIYDFNNLNSEDVENIIFDYAKTLRGAKEYRSMDVNTILSGMSSEELDRLIGMSVKKSEPLFRYDYKGYVPSEQISEVFYIGVDDKETSILAKDNRFKDLIGGSNNVQFVNTNVKDRIIVYRQIGVIPAFCISALDSYKPEYERLKKNKSPHIDALLERRMVREEFDFLPTQTSDDSMELWVNGILFGMISKEETTGKYRYKNEKEGDIIDDYWVSLSVYRDDAFNMFKSHKNEIREQFNNYIEKLEKDKGSEYIKEIINDAKDNYWLKYSLLDMDSAKLKAKGNEALLDLFSKELLYVKGM